MNKSVDLILEELALRASDDEGYVYSLDGKKDIIKAKSDLRKLLVEGCPKERDYQTSTFSNRQLKYVDGYNQARQDFIAYLEEKLK